MIGLNYNIAYAHNLFMTNPVTLNLICYSKYAPIEWFVLTKMIVLSVRFLEISFKIYAI